MNEMHLFTYKLFTARDVLRATVDELILYRLVYSVLLLLLVTVEWIKKDFSFRFQNPFAKQL